MKKILIFILIILLIILAYFSIARGIPFLHINSFNSIKVANTNLDNNYNAAKEIANKTYPAQVEQIENAIKDLKIRKQQYDNKKLSGEDGTALGNIEVKNYMLHYLWTILGNYRKDRGVQTLNLALKTTQAENVYDLEFTLLGKYTNITDFIYDIENDEQLNFEIEDFSISSEIEDLSSIPTEDTSEGNNSNILDNSENSDGQKENNNNQSKDTTNGENKQASQGDGITLQAKFTVRNVGITLD